MKRRRLLPILGAGAAIAALGFSLATLVASAAPSAASSAGRLSRASALPPFTSGVYAVSANGRSCTWNVKVTGGKISGTMPCAGEPADPLFGRVVQGKSITVTRDCHARFPPDCRQDYVVTGSKNGVMTGTFTANAAAGGPGTFAFTATPPAGKCSTALPRKGLQKPPSGTPVARYGPITVFSRIPGLKITRRGAGWVISGIKVATLGGTWVIDGGHGGGRIVSTSASSSINSNGKAVATVGDHVKGREVADGPIGIVDVDGLIITGDPRIAINGRPIAIPGSKITYVPFCASGNGAVK